MRADPPSLLRQKVVWVSGIGVPNAASSNPKVNDRNLNYKKAGGEEGSCANEQ